MPVGLYFTLVFACLLQKVVCGLYILFAVHRIVMSAQMAVPKGMSAQMAVLKETIANVVGKRYGAQDVVEEVDDEVINVETSLNQTKVL